jgi:hypothetical protein
MIWHTYAQQMFEPLPVQQFLTPQFSGQTWILAPSSMLKTKAKSKSKKHNPNPGVSAPPTGSPAAYPTPTQTCPPGVSNVDCVAPGSSPPANGPDATPTPTTSSIGIGGLGGVTTPDARGSDGAPAGAAVAGSAVALPLALFWVRKRGRRGRRRG